MGYQRGHSYKNVMMMEKTNIHHLVHPRSTPGPPTGQPQSWPFSISLIAKRKKGRTTIMTQSKPYNILFSGRAAKRGTPQPQSADGRIHIAARIEPHLKLKIAELQRAIHREAGISMTTSGLIIMALENLHRKYV
jgi:hypothetical protein